MFYMNIMKLYDLAEPRLISLEEDLDHSVPKKKEREGERWKFVCNESFMQIFRNLSSAKMP